MSKLDKALSNLRKAMKDLPEYHALMQLKGFHSRIETTVVEYSHIENHHPNVEYKGLYVKRGDNAFLLECCGLEYFTSNLSPKLISAQIQLAVESVKGSLKVPVIRGLNMTGYHISSKLREVFSLTDEVFPHMKDEAVGCFKVTY